MQKQARDTVHTEIQNVSHKFAVDEEILSRFTKMTPTGYQEVESILESKPLQSFESN
ncbi:MAG: hypothetical protein AB7G87_07015 [Clostridia bacterium]